MNRHIAPHVTNPGASTTGAIAPLRIAGVAVSNPPKVITP